MVRMRGASMTRRRRDALQGSPPARLGLGGAAAPITANSSGTTKRAIRGPARHPARHDTRAVRGPVPTRTLGWWPHERPPWTECARSGRLQVCPGEPAVTLCYRRARAVPEAGWPYNLFCMIHGRNRAEVDAEITALCVRHGLAAYPQAVLFSVRRFKQRGAHYIKSNTQQEKETICG